MADVVSGDQSGANPSSNRLTIDAALTEWVYHRADQDQGLSLREIAKDASIQIIDGFLKMVETVLFIIAMGLARQS